MSEEKIVETFLRESNAIEEYSGAYRIGKDGRIFSLRSRCFLKVIRRDRYDMVCLYKDKRRTYRTIHRLVAVAYIPNLLRYPQVNHKNGNKRDNSVENLEWCTQSQNMHHAWDTGLARVTEAHQESARKAGYGRRKLKPHQVRSMRRLYRDGKASTYELAGAYGVHQAQAWRIVRGISYGNIR